MIFARRNRIRTIGPLKPHLCTTALLGVLFLAGCAGVLESLKTLNTETKNQQIEKSTDQFEKSKALVAQGNYEGAYKENHRILSEGKGSQDVALFNMGMVSAYSLNPRKNYPRALISFRTLIADYPHSHLAEQAKVWIHVLEEHQRVADERQRVLEDKQKLLEEKRSAIREREKLSDEKEKLSQEREKLRYAAEKSRQVDLEIEKRRREALKK